MEINNQIQANTNSVRQALNVAVLRKTMSKDAQTATKLLEGMEASAAKIQQSTSGHIGTRLDVRA